MAAVIDNATGQSVEIPDGDLHARWAAGEVQPVAGARYSVRLSNGTYGTVPAESLGVALRGGAQVVAPSEAKAAAFESRYGGAAGAIGAAAEGAVSQATLGLSDEVLRAASPETLDLAQRVSERHPIASMVGQGLGAAALSGLTGVGAAAEGLGEAATAGMGGGLASRIAARGIVSGLRGAAEGAQFGVAQAISDDAITDHQQTAQQMLSTLGGNMLWGGALGAGFGLLSQAGSEALRGRLPSPDVLDRALAPGRASDEEIGAVAGRAVGVDAPADGLGAKVRKWYAKLSSAASGADEGAIDALTSGALEPGSVGYANRQALLEADATRTAASRDIRQHVDTMLEASRAVQEEGQRGLKRGYIRAAVADVDPQAAATSARGMVDRTIATLDEMLAAPEDYGGAAPLRRAMTIAKRASAALDDAMLSAEADDFAHTTRRVPLEEIETKEPWSANKFNTATRKLANGERPPPVSLVTPDEAGPLRIQDGIHRVAAARAQGLRDIEAEIMTPIRSPRDAGTWDVAEMFGVIDDLKKAIGKYTKGASRLSPMAATDELVSLQNRARAAKLQELYESLRQGLEDEGTWKKAAQDQKAINAAWTTQIDASDRFHRALTTEIGRDPQNPWSTVRGVDPAKADAYVRNLMNPAQDLTHKAVTDYVSSTRRLADVMAEAYDLPADKRAAVARLGQAADRFQDTIDKTSKTLSLVNQFEELRARTQGHATHFAAAAGMAAHGIEGGLAGLAIGKIAHLFTRPADTVMQLAQVERMARESDGRIARAIRALSSGRFAAPARTSTEAFARKSAQVSALAADAPRLLKRVAANTAPLRGSAPRLADALTGVSLAGLALLRDKMPVRAPADPLDPKRRAPPPSYAEQARWLRYYDAVTDPLGVVDDLRSGRMSIEGVEVLKTVYPALFARTRDAVAGAMADGKLGKLTSQQRVGLGVLLDLPLPELAPSSIAFRQSLYATPQIESPSDAGASPKGRRAGKVDLTKNVIASSRVDRVEMGGDS